MEYGYWYLVLNKYCHFCFTIFDMDPENRKWLRCRCCNVRKYHMQIITLSDLITSSGKYPDRANSPELTAQLKDNGVQLLNKVNQLLEELKITSATVSSGFRTSVANTSISN